jgi:flagellar hook-associated protein 3 FlgL
MRISTSSLSTSLINEIQSLGTQQSTLQQQLATGLSVTNPSDAPATVGNVLNQTSEMQSLQQYSANNGTATAIAQQGYSSLTSLNSIATSASELATEGSAGTTSAATYQAYSAQVNQLINQAFQTANTQYNNQYIFGGSQTGSVPFTAHYDSNGNITSVTYNNDPNSAGISIPTGEGSTASPYTDGSTNTEIAGFITNMIALRDAMSGSSPSASDVQATQAPLQASETNIINAVSGLSAVQGGIEADETLNQSRFTSLQSQVSGETSVDVATASVQLSQAQTAYQAALQSGAKMLQTSLLNYIQ